MNKMAENAREIGLDYEPAQIQVPVKDNTYGYAKSLAEAIFKQHFASDEHYASGRVVWGVNDTVIGILTQIDNMVADMVRKPEQPAYRAVKTFHEGKPVYVAEQPAQQEPVNEGWKLVPVEPTADMWKAVNKLNDDMAAGGYDGKGCSIEQAWNCLLDAAPSPPAQQTVAVPNTLYEHYKFVLVGRKWYKRFATQHDDCQIGEQLTWQEKTIRQQGYENGWNDAQRYLREVQATHPQAREWQGLTDEERDHIWHTVGNSDAHGDVDGWSGRNVMAAIEAKLREKNA